MYILCQTLYIRAEQARVAVAGAYAAKRNEIIAHSPARVRFSCLQILNHAVLFVASNVNGNKGLFAQAEIVLIKLPPYEQCPADTVAVAVAAYADIACIPVLTQQCGKLRLIAIKAEADVVIFRKHLGKIHSHPVEPVFTLRRKKTYLELVSLELPAPQSRPEKLFAELVEAAYQQ